MSVNKILSISIIFVSAFLLSGNCHAYDDEGGLDFENESYHADYSVWQDSVNWYTQTPAGTYVYSIDNWYGVGAICSWASWQITCMFVNDVEIPTEWTLQGKTWDETTESYEDKGTEYVVGYVMSVTGGSEVTETSTMNVVEQYFVNDTSRAEDFVGTDEDSEHPDYVEVTMVVGNGMENITHTETVGITMSGGEAESASTRGEDTDYGFGSGSGGEGGVGDIYSSVGEGIGDGDSGIQPVFQILFYCLIPLIFILSVMKMIGRLSDV